MKNNFKKCDQYFSIDIFSGNLKLISPGLFAAEHCINRFGDLPRIKVYTGREVEHFRDTIIQSELLYRVFVRSGAIEHSYVPSSVVRNIELARQRMMPEKEKNIVRGYSGGFFISRIELAEAEAERYGDRYLGNESESAWGFMHRKDDGKKIYVIPGSLLAVVEGSKIQYMLNSSFLKNTYSKFKQIIRLNRVDIFPTKRKDLESLAEAHINRRVQVTSIIQKIIADANQFISKDGDEKNTTQE
jgi:hypothetical protein